MGSASEDNSFKEKKKKKKRKFQGASSKSITRGPRVDLRPCRRHRSLRRRSSRPCSSHLGCLLDHGPGPSLSLDLGNPGRGLDLTLQRRERAFIRSLCPGPESCCCQEEPLPSLLPCRSEPLPTSPSAVLGPAVLVQLLGIIVIVLISHRLLTLSILEPRAEESRNVVIWGTMNHVLNYTRHLLLPFCTLGTTLDWGRAMSRPGTHTCAPLHPPQPGQCLGPSPFPEVCTLRTPRPLSPLTPRGQQCSCDKQQHGQASGRDRT